MNGPYPLLATFYAAFLLVFMPAVILKQSAAWLLRADTNRPRIRLLCLSIGGSLVAIIATLTVRFLVSGTFGVYENSYIGPSPQLEVMIAYLVAGIAVGSDLLLWRQFAKTNGAQPLTVAVIWLCGTNAWVPWAIWLLRRLREGIIVM